MTERDEVEGYKQGDRQTCVDAMLFGVSAGLVVSISSLFIAQTFYTSVMGPGSALGVGLGSFFGASAVLTGCAWLCLPLVHVGARVAEILVCLSWVAGTAQLIIYMMFFSIGGGEVTWSDPAGIIYNVCLLVFVLAGPVPFMALCWGRMDRPVMRLVAGQMQWKIVAALVVWATVAKVMGLVSAVPHATFYWIILCLLTMCPLFMGLFLDAMVDQSQPFMLCMPVLYIVYVGAQMYYHGVVLTPHILRNSSADAADSPFRNGGGQMVTDSYQVGSTLSTILLLMLQFLYNVFTDRLSTKKRICWPIAAHIRVLKSDAHVILNQMTMMGQVKVQACD
jgi:hypothetical protein